jgi:hypothetical protein
MNKIKDPILSSFVNIQLLKNFRKTVTISVQFDRIGEIDTMNENFYAELTIEAKWKENKIIEKYSPEFEWNPKLYIENAINEPKERVKYSVVNEEDCTIVTEFRTVKG